MEAVTVYTQGILAEGGKWAEWGKNENGTKKVSSQRRKL